MSQLKFDVDITDMEFPMLYDWAPRTVLQEQVFEGAPPNPKPQLLYCQDVLATQQGYKSVSYKNIVAAATPANLTFAQVFMALDPSQNRCLIGITSNSMIYMLTNALPTWVNVTPTGWAGTDAVTMGDANGIYYLYLANKGCYQINITTPGLAPVTLTGITAANILGMSSAVNYLILWDATGTVYWSSTVNPLDFTPSLITGAGSQVPNDLNGKIVVIIALNNGFAVYTTANIVLASFSNNTQYPWVFRNANNSSGISSYKQVSYSGNLSFHVASTFAGIIQVTAQGCTVIVPEVTDFIAARIYESYDAVNDILVKTELTSTFTYRISVIAARFIVLSYGITNYTDALVYDSALKRWGKMHINHTCCFEVDVSLEGVISPYNDPAEIGQSYASATPQTYGSATVTMNNPPVIGRIFGFLQADGTIVLAYLGFASGTDNGVLMLGKFQAVRSTLMELQEIAVEAITSEQFNFAVRVMPSINGKDLLPAITPTLVTNGTGVRVYKCRSVGKNHTVVFKGSFNLTTAELTAVAIGRR